MRRAADPDTQLVLTSVLGDGSLSVPDLNDSGWKVLWESARNHCLTPYVVHRWTTSGVLDRVPRPFASRFLAARAQNTERNLRILFELREILAALSHAGIQALVLKGLPLAAEYYGDIGLRVLYDLDLLVRPEDGPRAYEILRRSGYAPYFKKPRLDWESPGLLWRPRDYAWDAERVFDPERPIFLELHFLPWEPEWHGFHLDCRLDLWEGRRAMVISNVHMEAPCPEKMLVHLTLHYAFNVLESTARLMHLLDIGLLIRSSPGVLQWDRILALIRESRVAPFCFITLDLASRICRLDIPEQFMSELRAATPPGIVRWLETEGVDSVACISLYDRDRALIYFLHWSAASGWKERTEILLYALRNPWKEAKRSGSWSAFLVRMLQRAGHLAASVFRRRRR